MPPLTQCIYASTAVREFKAEELAELLRQARAANERLDLTGMLLYTEGSFFQVLEGETDVIDTLYAKLTADKRHEKMVKIIQEPIPRKSFSDWSMGFSVISRQELGQIDGMNDFFREGHCYGELDSGRAKKLLDAFRQER